MKTFMIDFYNFPQHLNFKPVKIPKIIKLKNIVQIVEYLSLIEIYVYHFKYHKFETNTF